MDVFLYPTWIDDAKNDINILFSVQKNENLEKKLLYEKNLKFQNKN